MLVMIIIQKTFDYEEKNSDKKTYQVITILKEVISQVLFPMIRTDSILVNSPYNQQPLCSRSLGKVSPRSQMIMTHGNTRMINVNQTRISPNSIIWYGHPCSPYNFGIFMEDSFDNCLYVTDEGVLFPLFSCGWFYFTVPHFGYFDSRWFQPIHFVEVAIEC